tara:strand:+ start:1879 stop:2124 length:246 start_codon:yes stop_codon:yes gene_type:complete
MTSLLSALISEAVICFPSELVHERTASRSLPLVQEIITVKTNANWMYLVSIIRGNPDSKYRDRSSQFDWATLNLHRPSTGR